MSTSIMMRTANLRDLLRNQFGCSPLACGAFSSETSLFLFTFLHSYFMLNSNIFLQKWHNKLTLTSVMRIWRVDTIIAGGWIGGIKGMSPGSVPLPSSPIHCSAPFTCRYFSYLTPFFPFFLHCGAWSHAISPFDGQSAWHIQKNQQWTTHKLNALNVKKKIK